MKKINYILGVLVAFLTVNSCVGDLNVTPIDPNANTADKALVNEAAFEQFLSGVYLGFATSGYYGANGSASISGLDGGASQYIRGLYHHSELTTDESVCGWNDQTIKNFHWMNWTTDDTFIYAFYSRIFMQVGMANEFIREAKASDVDFAKKQQYIDEARVLRALAYYHAIDNFGNVPFADETAVVGVNPDQKLYLNAEVYTGAAAYDKCANVLADLMDDGYSLHTTSAGTYSAYQELFLADNDRCTDEIIFAVEQDGVNTTSYGATNYLIFASTGGAMDPDEMGISSGWGGLRMTPEFYGKFSSDDARALFYTDTQNADIDDIGEFSNGMAFRKFRNRTSDGGYGKESGFVDTDFPMMRYADVLLMAAECQVRGAAVSGAITGFNEVRARAGVARIANPTLQDILDERARELYQECWRRSDLIRFGKFTSGYNWQWKGNVKEGTDVDAYRALFPIPDSDRLANTKLQQNPGYGTNK